MKRIIAIIAVLLMASLAGASTLAPSASNANGKTFEMCTALSSSGVCANAAGQHLYAEVMSSRKFTVFFSETGSGGATCEVYAGSQDLINNRPVELAATDGTKINSISLSAAATAQSFEAPFAMLWIECVAGAGTHTVLLQTSN